MSVGSYWFEQFCQVEYFFWQVSVSLSFLLDLQTAHCIWNIDKKFGTHVHCKSVDNSLTALYWEDERAIFYFTNGFWNLLDWSWKEKKPVHGRKELFHHRRNWKRIAKCLLCLCGLFFFLSLNFFFLLFSLQLIAWFYRALWDNGLAPLYCFSSLNATSFMLCMYVRV